MAQHRLQIIDSVKSKATIILPFKVLKKVTAIKRLNNGKTGTNFVYIDLTANQLSNYCQLNDEEVQKI